MQPQDKLQPHRRVCEIASKQLLDARQPVFQRVAVDEKHRSRLDNAALVKEPFIKRAAVVGFELSIVAKQDLHEQLRRSHIG